MSDLVKRLRVIADIMKDNHFATTPDTLREAADAIEAYEEALRTLIEDVENKWGDPHTLHDARAALEKHK